MTDEAMEKRLKAAVEQTAPDDFTSVLCACEERKGTVIVMPQKKRNRLTAVVAAVAVLAILLGGGFGFVQYRAANTVDAVVALDVNPSIELKVNKAEKVLAVHPLNDDAVTILGDMDLKGADVEVAVNALIGSMLRAGYIDELSNSVLISVEGDEARSQALEERLSQAVSNAISGTVQPAVLTQTVSENETLRKMAEDYGISLGRAQLINSILEKDPTKTFADLAALTVNELNLLCSAKQAETDNLTVTGAASQKAYIGESKAEEIALERAGVSRSQAAAFSTHMDWEDGVLVYSVEFWADRTEYDCDVNALTGAVVDFEAEGPGLDDDDDDHRPTTGPSGGGTVTAAVTLEEAKAAALKDAGLTAGQVTFRTAKLDEDDGRMIYDIAFTGGGTEYDYEISAATGKILDRDIEVDDDLPAALTESPSGSQSGQPLIGKEEARKKALAHAGVSASRAWGVEVELETEDGVQVYEVSFHAGDFEYDYEIDAVTGEIRSSDSEIDD